MTLSMKEKKILYAFACPSHHNTVTRLKWLTALTVDPEAKRRMLGLARKMETEVDESWYEAFYHHLRMEMDECRRLKRSLRVLKSYTDYEEDFSGEKSMREAFEQLIERQTCEHFEEWLEQREMAENAA